MNLSDLNNVVQETMKLYDHTNQITSPYFNSPGNPMQPFMNQPYHPPMKFSGHMNVTNLNKEGIKSTNRYYIEKIKKFLFKEI